MRVEVIFDYRFLRPRDDDIIAERLGYDRTKNALGRHFYCG